MKSYFKSALVFVSLALGNAAFAADATVTLSPDLANGVIAQVQKYAQVCLVNNTNRAVLVGTSWFGEGRTMAIIPSGEEHIYRFEKTGTIMTQETVAVARPSLNVAFRERGLFTQWHQSDAPTLFSYVKTNNCDAMAKYEIRYVSVNNEVDLQLVRVMPIVYAVTN